MTVDLSETSGPSGRRIKVGKAEAAYWAYVPDPLPPQLALDQTIARLVNRASLEVGRLAGTVEVLRQYHASLPLRPLLAQEAVLSSRIEGTRAGLADVYAYQVAQRSGESKAANLPADVAQVNNALVAMEYGVARLVKLPISLRLLHELHAELMRGVREDRTDPGEFRRSQNWIGKPGANLSQATYVPPPPYEMIQCLDMLEKYIHAPDDYPPLLRLAFIHAQFEAIHPFLDGNGRLGRMLVSLLAVTWGLLPIPLPVSAYILRHQDDYYRMLLGVTTFGTWREWVEFFVRGLSEQARETTEKLRSLVNLRRRWRDDLAKVRAAAMPLRLADHLFEMPMLTIPLASQTLGISYPATKSIVAKLQAAGILRQADGGSHAKLFVADEIISIVEKQEETNQTMPTSEELTSGFDALIERINTMQARL